MEQAISICMAIRSAIQLLNAECKQPVLLVLNVSGLETCGPECLQGVPRRKVHALRTRLLQAPCGDTE